MLDHSPRVVEDCGRVSNRTSGGKLAVAAVKTTRACHRDGKAVRFVACLKFLLSSIFAPGGLDLNMMGMQPAVNEFLEGDGSFLEEVKAISPVKSQLRATRYNPYV